MTVFAEGNSLVIEINDDGSGISPVLQPHIFELSQNPAERSPPVRVASALAWRS
jgi:signal transduction histidine kinase